MSSLIFFTLGLWATILQLVFSIPANSSNKGVHVTNRASPQISELWKLWKGELAVAKVEQGIIDACVLAQAGFLEVKAKQAGNSCIYDKYFPDKNRGSDLNNVRTIFGNIVQVKQGEPPFPSTDCSTFLSHITISPDIPNPDNENQISCTDASTMASMRYGNSKIKNPIMILCESALQRGNIGPTQITVDGEDAPPPVTCDMVQKNGLRTTWRMNTLGAIILHEYTHWATLVEAAIPGGTVDYLTHSNVPAIEEGKREFFYGPNAMQSPWISQVYGPMIADSYAWMASEAMWSKKCNVLYAPSIQNDDADPVYGGQPGTEPVADDTNDDGSVSQ